MFTAIFRKLHPRLGSPLKLLCVVAALTLVLAAAALAAHPTAGRKYTGFTSVAKVNGFRAPVSFTVSSSGSKLLSFKYGNLGCPSQSGPTGDPYTGGHAAITTVGMIHVSSAGTFSVKNLKSGSSPTYTISSVTGKFKTAKTATGSIKLVNWFSVPGNTHRCGSSSATFTATTK
jgi:hypothetical protein